MLVTRGMPGRLGPLLEREYDQTVLIPDDLGRGDEMGFLSARESRIDLMVIDHYDISESWEANAAQVASHVMVIDDVAAASHSASILLNQNLGFESGDYEGLIPSTTSLLLGPTYALLRAEFAAARRKLRPRKGTVSRVLVFISGSDPHDVTGMAVRALIPMATISVDVVCGSAYERLAELDAELAGRPGFKLHVDVPPERMAAMMSAADLSVGAPSSASWERACLGLPAVIIILAENQVRVAHALERQGAAYNLGWHHGVTAQAITAAIDEMRASPDRLLEMGRRSAALTDGEGCPRVAAAIERL